MKIFCQRVGEFLREEHGPTAVEYAVLLALIMMTAIGAVTLLGTNLSGSYEDSLDSMNAAMGR